MEHITKYVEATNESSSRSRWVFLALQVASVIVFFAFWNTHVLPWTNARLKLYQAALYLQDQDATRQQKPRGAPKPGFTAPLTPVGLSRFTEDELKGARRFLDQEKPSRDQVEHLWREYQSLKVQHVSHISIPLFQTMVDVNDLGFLGGLAFIILLTLLR